MPGSDQGGRRRRCSRFRFALVRFWLIADRARCGHLRHLFSTLLEEGRYEDSTAKNEFKFCSTMQYDAALCLLSDEAAREVGAKSMDVHNL